MPVSGCQIRPRFLKRYRSKIEDRNSAKILEKIPIEDRASEVHLDNDGLPVVKTLGVTWLPDEDVYIQGKSSREGL